MNNDTQLAYEPMTTAHPGETVVDYLDSKCWSQRDLARRTGLTPKTVSEICNGKAPITPPTALALEKVLQRPAHFWLNLQRQFDEAEARQQAAAKFDQWDDWAKKFPLKELKKYEWLELKGPQYSVVDALLSFLGVSSPESWDAVWKASNVSYRQTQRAQTSPEAVAAWVRQAELDAEEINVKEFDENRLRSSLDELRKLSAKRVDLTEIEKICAAAGVAFVVLPELPKTGISGCARWLTDKKALIGLTLRYKRADHFWFTFFHEIAHLLLHKKKHDFILDNAIGLLTDKIVDPEMQRYEEEANRFAADTLIPPAALFWFLKKGVFTTDSICSFSKELNIGPGIVVGRLQHDGHLRQHQGNTLHQWLKGVSNDESQE